LKAYQVLTDWNEKERLEYDRESIFAGLSDCVAGGFDLVAHQIPLEADDVLFILIL
jgi:hypothetical protein